MFCNRYLLAAILCGLLLVLIKAEAATALHNIEGQLGPIVKASTSIHNIEGQNEIDQLEAKVSRLQAEAKKLRDANKQLSDELAGSKAQVNRLNAEADQLRAKNKADIQNLLDLFALRDTEGGRPGYRYGLDASGTLCDNAKNKGWRPYAPRKGSCGSLK